MTRAAAVAMEIILLRYVEMRAPKEKTAHNKLAGVSRANPTMFHNLTKLL